MNPTVQKWIIDQISGREKEYIKTLQDLVQIPSPNPPGDTRPVANYITKILKNHGLEYDVYYPRDENPIVVAKYGSGLSPKLTLSGHLDVFPVADVELWSDDPFSGTIKDGKLYGRGSSDMKAGVAAALGAFLLLSKQKDNIDGTIILALDSDEENGSEWGAWWLSDNVPEVFGDACLIGEPTGCTTPLIGQKAPLWLSITTKSQPRHGALSDGRDAIWSMAKVIIAIQTVNDLFYPAPPEIAPIVEKLKRKQLEEQGGGEWWLEKPSVNFGHVGGGVKVNIVPSSCELQADVRVPFGSSVSEILDEIRQRIKNTGVEAEVRIILGEREKPNYTLWDTPFLQVLRQSINTVTGVEAQPLMLPYYTDGRVYRNMGVATACCGPIDYNMAGIDECIDIDEFINVLKVFSLTAASFCGLRNIK